MQHKWWLRGTTAYFSPEGMAGGDGGAGGDAGGAGGAADVKAGPTREEFDSFVQSTMGLKSSIDGLLTLAQKAQQDAANAAALRDQQGDDDGGEGPTDTELETMPRSKLVAHLQKEFAKEVKQLLGPLQEQLNNVSSATTTDRIGRAVEELKGKHPDFLEWRDEMLTLASSYKGMPPDQLYILAQGSNPEKVKAMRTKYKLDSPSGPIKIPFGGYTPGGGSSGSKSNRKMNGMDAATSAWTATVAALGGEPAFEE